MTQTIGNRNNFDICSEYLCYNCITRRFQIQRRQIRNFSKLQFVHFRVKTRSKSWSREMFSLPYFPVFFIPAVSAEEKEKKTGGISRDETSSSYRVCVSLTPFRLVLTFKPLFPERRSRSQTFLMLHVNAGRAHRYFPTSFPRESRASIKRYTVNVARKIQFSRRKHIVL